MIEIGIFKNLEFNTIYSVEVKGHANYADHGEDIVCAAVSTLVYTLIASMEKVLKLNKNKYRYEIDEKNGSIKLKIFIETLSDEELYKTDLLTKIFKTGIVHSIEDYKDYAKITIEEV